MRDGAEILRVHKSHWSDMHLDFGIKIPFEDLIPAELKEMQGILRSWLREVDALIVLKAFSDTEMMAGNKEE